MSHSLYVKPCGSFLRLECVRPISYFETCAVVEGQQYGEIMGSLAPELKD
jgi:hypothetical protein